MATKSDNLPNDFGKYLGAMGGYGSGRWHDHQKKTPVEDCLAISTASLGKERLLDREASGVMLRVSAIYRDTEWVEESEWVTEGWKECTFIEAQSYYRHEFESLYFSPRGIKPPPLEMRNLLI